MRLNAPYGAWCFLTDQRGRPPVTGIESLNAPYGARCFLTSLLTLSRRLVGDVLMHLMALGAF